MRAARGKILHARRAWTHFDTCVLLRQCNIGCVAKWRVVGLGSQCLIDRPPDVVATLEIRHVIQHL